MLSSENLKNLSSEEVEDLKKILDSLDDPKTKKKFLKYLKKLSNLENKIPVSSFICKILHSEKCNPYGLKISNSLIRVAASRIFSEPEQSVMELVANSIDAYNSMKGIQPIGKFGMGFFSMLYWLADSDDGNFKRTMEIVSIYKDTTIKSYTASLKWSENGLVFKISRSTPPENVSTFTLIRLNSNGYDFTEEQLSKMNKELRKFFDVTSVKIEVNSWLINYSDSEDIVFVSLKPDSLSFEDYATGISEKTLFNSLLIPSSSSKERSLEKNKPSNPKIRNYVIPSFHIIVNSVSIVNIVLNIPGYKKYIIYLPNNSSLPVSRDDIIYHKKEVKNFKKQILKLVKNILETDRNLIPLFELLEYYVNKNNQFKLFEVFNKIKNKVLNMDLILIPNDPFLISLLDFLGIKNYAFYPYYDKFKINEQLYDQLIKISRKDIFKLRNVISFKMKILMNNFLPSFLFVNADLNNSNDISKLINNSDETLLIPCNEKINIEEIKPDNLYISKEVENNYLILKMTFFKKFQNINFEDKFNILRELTSKFIKYSNNSDKELKDFLVFFNSKISNIKFNYTYGVSRNVYVFKPLSFHRNYMDNNSIYVQGEEISNYINKRILLYSLDVLLENHSGTHFWFPDCSSLSVPLDFSIVNDIDSIKKVLEKCITNEEFLIFSYVLVGVLNYLFYVPSKNIQGVFMFILSEIRRKYTNQTLADVISKHINNLIGGTESFNNITSKDLLMSATQYIYSMNSGKIIKLPNIKPKYKFSSKSLLKYIYGNNISNETFFKDLSKDYLTFQEDQVKLQIIEIAVNEGTTKPFSQAVITELLQNSIDALNGSSGTIQVNTSSNTISVKDSVGISSLEVLITLLIPFLSSKDPNSPTVTGEMGTGFFNVFRQPYVEKVYILTNIAKIECIPLVENNNVHDIEYNIEINASKVNETEVIIILRNNMPDIINDINLFVNNKTGFHLQENLKKDELLEIATNSGYKVTQKTTIKELKTIVYKNNVKIKLNSIEVTKKYIKIYNTELGEIFYSKRDFPSFLQTNGMAFSDLDIFLGDYEKVFKQFKTVVKNSVIVNLFKSSYVPNQSRNKIKVHDKLQMTKFLNRGFYFLCLFIYSNGYAKIPDDFIRFTTSTANISQLRIASYKLHDDKFPETEFNKLNNSNLSMLLSSSYFHNHLTIAGTINDIISKPDSLKTMNFKSLEKGFLFEKTIKNWFSNKDFSKREKENIVIANKSDKGNISEEDAKIPWVELQIFIDIYWKEINKLVSSGYLILENKLSEKPMILYGKVKNNVLGFYDVKLNVIVMKVEHYNPEKLNKSLIKIKKLDIKNSSLLFQTDPEITKYFGSNITTTLIHELGHAIQSSSHNESSHGMTKIKFKDGEFMEFEEMCLDIYKKCNENGLILKYITEIKKILEKR